MTSTSTISSGDDQGIATDPSPAKPKQADIEAACSQFIAIWGQMGSKWGIPRTMAEVHALLFIEGRPMNTDEVMEHLQISRGNASMTLRNLVDWGIVRNTHLPGDRKEYFVAEQDVWKMFRTIVRERKKREIDPLLEALHDCRQQTNANDSEEAVAHNRRLDDMIEVMGAVDAISRRFVSPMGQGLKMAAKLLSRTSTPAVEVGDFEQEGEA